MEKKNVSIRTATPSDLPHVLQLLQTNNLPIEGIEASCVTMIVAQLGQDIIGCAALELYEKHALLRSVSIAPTHHGKGIGQQLTDSILEIAHQNEILSVYLLTETAESFFKKRGFKPVERSNVPFSITQSVEFTSVCPASALSMELVL